MKLYVSLSFGKRTLFLLKGGISCHGKSATVDELREIAISRVLSKVREHCILVQNTRLYLQAALLPQKRQRVRCVSLISCGAKGISMC